MKLETKFNKIIAAVLLLLAAAAVWYLSTQFLSMRENEPIYPQAGTEKKMLSDWYDGLKGTAADTEVYIIRGKEEGGSMLVLGGTHGNEPSGLVAATLLLENAKMEAGTLYVIPRANLLGLTCTDPQEAAPMRFTISTPGGDRWFRFGSRASNPVFQWPDPDIYVHKSSGQRLSGSETRNLNRAYPGRTDGTLTEKIAYGVAALIRAEKIDIEVDLHEASPEYPTIHAIVAHERAMDIAAEAKIWMEVDGIDISIESSPKNLHGLTHRELGDYTDTLALLMETANGSQGRLRGATNEELVVTGKDKYYVKAAEYGRLYVPYDENGHPISERVARHITGIMQFAEAFTGMGDRPIIIGGIPTYGEMLADLGPYLDPTD